MTTTTKRKLTLPEVRKAWKRVIEEKGDQSNLNNYCTHFAIQEDVIEKGWAPGDPVCVVGHVLVELGLGPDDLKDYTGNVMQAVDGLYDLPYLELTPAALEFLAARQEVADSQLCPWREIDELVRASGR